MTVDEIVTEALARADEWSRSYRPPHQMLYRRIGYHRRELALAVARENPDYHGAAIEADLEDGIVDVRDIVSPLPVFGQLYRVEVLDPGESDLPTGWPVTIVPTTDVESGVRPRMIFRDRVLTGVGSDLNGVRSVTIHFLKLPEMIAHTDGATVVDMEPPFDNLLVLDLAREIVAHAPTADHEGARAVLGSEYVTLMGSYMQHVMSTPTAARFSRPPLGVTQPPEK
jgi:hypothetical protein